VNFLESIIYLLILFIMVILSLAIYLNLKKYKEGAMSLLFNRKSETIRVCQIFAAAMVIFALNRLLGIGDSIYPHLGLATIYSVTWFILIILFIYILYALYNIMRLKES